MTSRNVTPTVFLVHHSKYDCNWNRHHPHAQHLGTRNPLPKFDSAQISHIPNLSRTVAPTPPAGSVPRLSSAVLGLYSPAPKYPVLRHNPSSTAKCRKLKSDDRSRLYTSDRVRTRLCSRGAALLEAGAGGTVVSLQPLYNLPATKHFSSRPQDISGHPLHPSVHSHPRRSLLGNRHPPTRALSDIAMT